SIHTPPLLAGSVPKLALLPRACALSSFATARASLATRPETHPAFFPPQSPPTSPGRFLVSRQNLSLAALGKASLHLAQLVPQRRFEKRQFVDAAKNLSFPLLLLLPLVLFQCCPAPATSS